jgi:hypothetical protein
MNQPRSMQNALIYGSAMASFCVERFGTERLVDLSEAELNARIAEFKKLSNFSI